MSASLGAGSGRRPRTAPVAAPGSVPGGGPLAASCVRPFTAGPRAEGGVDRGGGLGSLGRGDHRQLRLPGIGAGDEQARHIGELVLSGLHGPSALNAHPSFAARPVRYTDQDQPLDRARWAIAVAGLPPLADPSQLRRDQLPTTAT